MIELNVSIKTSESTLKHKVLTYETVELDPDDPVIRKAIDESLKLLNIDPQEIEDIKVRTLLVIK